MSAWRRLCSTKAMKTHESIRQLIKESYDGRDRVPKIKTDISLEMFGLQTIFMAQERSTTGE